jgi:hypothetical protein
MKLFVRALKQKLPAHFDLRYPAVPWKVIVDFVPVSNLHRDAGNGEFT